MISFNPSDDLAVLVARGKLDVEAWRQARGDDKEPPWGEWAGDQLEPMKRSRAVTSLNLKSQDASQRLAAVAIVAEHWLAGRTFAQDILRLAFDDPEPAIRGAALTALQLHAQFIADPTRTLRKLLAELFPFRPQSRREKHSRDEWYDERLKGILRKALGDKRNEDASRILESRSGAESYLTHADSELRRWALFALSNLWKKDDKLAQLFEKLACEDPNVQVRSKALFCLASYTGAGNERIEQLIAWIVFDSCEPREIRICAYQCLFLVARAKCPDALHPSKIESFRVPEDIDWAFVKSFFCFNERQEYLFFKEWRP